MDKATSQLELPPAIRRTLDDVRHRLRAYIWIEGFAVLVLVLGGAFWIGLLVDWFFEPSPVARMVALAMIALAALYVVYRYLLRRVFVRVTDASLALVLERKHPELGHYVLTAVHLASSPDEAARYNQALVSQTQQAAARAVANVEPARVFNRGPLLRTALTALAIGLSIFLFALVSRDVFAFYLERLALSPEPWPRRVQLEVVGFPPDAAGNRVHKLAQDDDFELVVRARADGHEIPEQVEIRYELADGGRGRDTLIRVGDAVRGRDEFQLYRYEFERVANDMKFDIVGGDDRVENLRLQVVDRPQLYSIELECTYPEYLGRAPMRLPVTGGMRIPDGTDVALRAQSTKPLTAARIRRVASAEENQLQLTGNKTELAWHYGPLRADDVLLVTVTDVDGVSNREPYRLSMTMAPDDVPQVAVRLSGIGTAVTPQATIPFAGKVTDEYGLDALWYEYQVDDGPVTITALTNLTGETLAVSRFDNFDLRSLGGEPGQRGPALAPGQKLKLTLNATDHYDLADAAREGASQQFALDVVTEADLLALIERRELELRQRYEAIYEKMTDTRNLVARVDFAGAEDGPSEPPAGATSSAASLSDEDRSEADQSAARSLARRRLRVSGAEQNVTQAADEILDVADGFDDLHDQLANNRIDNADLKSRLREQIAVPLRAIGDLRMPQLRASLKSAEEHIEVPTAGAAAIEASIALADEILVDMKQVLDRMLELETYNEVVALLRGIITDQEELSRRTKERQKERLQDLLE